MRLDGDALSGHVGVGAQIQGRVGGEHDRLLQPVQALAGHRRHVDEHGVAAVLLGDQPVLGQFAADADRVGRLLVDLVDRHHDRHVSRLGVVQRFDRLRHHAVIGRHHENRDVGRLRTTGTHGGERFVTGGVDEGDPPLEALDLGLYLVRADGLGDATGLLRDHVRVAQRIQQLRLAMVNVTHDGDDRRTGREVVLVAGVLTELQVEGLQQLTVLVLGADHLDLVVQLRAEHLQRVVGHRLGGVDHLTEVE